MAQPTPPWALATMLLAALAACNMGEIASPDVAPSPASASASPTPATGGPTFHKDVEPILAQHCQKCHATGGLAPFALLTYADARVRSPAMVAETTARRMPPWGAQDTGECKPRLPWNHDERLSSAQIKTLADWNAAGAPEGDPKDAPASVVVPAFELPSTNATLAPTTAFTASGARDQFQCFVLANPFPGGTYLNGVNVLPGNRKVVHHVVVFTDPTGTIAARAGADGSFECAASGMNSAAGVGLGGLTPPAPPQPGTTQPVTLAVWTPGMAPVDLPPNIGIPLAAGAKIVMQVHYSPGGTTAAPDLTKVQLRSGSNPEYLLYTTSMGNASGPLPNGDGLQLQPGAPPGLPTFLIPKNDRHHVESMWFTIPPAPAGATNPTTYLYGVMAHEHLAGVDVKVDLERGADTQCLLEDKWDFHWQRMYTYDAPITSLPTIEPGDRIKLRCTYDNAMANPRLGTELAARGLTPMDISLGEQTLDEMCLVIPQLLVKVR